MGSLVPNKKRDEIRRGVGELRRRREFEKKHPLIGEGERRDLSTVRFGKEETVEVVVLSETAVSMSVKTGLENIKQVNMHFIVGYEFKDSTEESLQEGLEMIRKQKPGIVIIEGYNFAKYRDDDAAEAYAKVAEEARKANPDVILISYTCDNRGDTKRMVLDRLGFDAKINLPDVKGEKLAKLVKGFFEGVVVTPPKHKQPVKLGKQETVDVVLIDETIIVDFTKRSLREIEQLRIHDTTDLEEGLDLIKKQKPGIVILEGANFAEPPYEEGGDAREAYERVARVAKEANPEVRLIAFTLDNSDTAWKMRDSFGFETVIRPDGGELVKTVQRYFGLAKPKDPNKWN